MTPARLNPFSTDRVLRERYRLSEDGWRLLLDRLRNQGGRGALVGAKGSGKTTLLEDLAGCLARQGFALSFVRLNAAERRVPDTAHHAFRAGLTGRDAVLLDGAEQLSWFSWLRFRRATRRAGVIVVTSHRGGRLPLLHRCQTTPALLRELCGSLQIEISQDEAVRLHRRHAGNLREALRELYDRWSEKEPDTLSLPIELDR